MHRTLAFVTVAALLPMLLLADGFSATSRLIHPAHAHAGNALLPGNLPLQAAQSDTPAAPSVLYVAMQGDDANDGLSPSHAKRSIAAAVRALPHMGQLGAGGAHYGVIHIGPGTFVEKGNLELNQSIQYIGAQAGLLDATGTTIKLADGANAPLFADTSDFIRAQAPNNAYSHAVVMKNLVLDGNAQQNRGAGAAGDLVDLSGGGYNTYFENVSFQNARRYGLYLNEKQVDFACYTCTFSDNLGGAVYANDTGSGTVISFIDTQLDNNGGDAIVIHTGDSNYANGGTYTFISLKGEATLPNRQVHLIRHDPAPHTLTYPPQITVIGSYAYARGGPPADSLFYESDAAGTEARWNLQNCFAQSGYRHGVFRSAKSGVHSQGDAVSHLISNDPSAAAAANPGMVAPDLQLSAGATISGGGDPNGRVAAVPASLFLDTADGVLWVKTRGDAKTGWSRVSVAPSRLPATVSHVVTLAAAAVIAPLAPLTHITGAATIRAIRVPASAGTDPFTGCLSLIPDGPWKTVTGGNIARGTAAIPGRVLQECYDGSRWYPSY